MESWLTTADLVCTRQNRTKPSNHRRFQSQTPMDVESKVRNDDDDDDDDVFLTRDAKMASSSSASTERLK